MDETIEDPAPAPALDQAPAPPLDMDEALADFEARCDKSDPDQVALLEAMREHTRRLHQSRGDWNRPNTRRNCNSAAPRDKATAPQAIESFRWGGQGAAGDDAMLLEVMAVVASKEARQNESRWLWRLVTGGPPTCWSVCLH